MHYLLYYFENYSGNMKILFKQQKKSDLLKYLLLIVVVFYNALHYIARF